MRTTLTESEREAHERYEVSYKVKEEETVCWQKKKKTPSE